MKPRINKEVERLGIDIHGVLDTHPKYFVAQALEVLKRKGEVHIITGVPFSDKVEKELLTYNTGEKYWTHFFSIESYLLAMNVPFEFNLKGRRSFEAKVWDKVKAHYCVEHKIDLHYDDAPEYAQYFSTPIMLFMPNPSFRRPPMIFDKSPGKTAPILGE